MEQQKNKDENKKHIKYMNYKERNNMKKNEQGKKP